MKDEDKISILSGVLVTLIIMTAGVFYIGNYFSVQNEIVLSEAYSERSTSQLRAMVKGSIYETGEFMTVFGTCLDANDIGVSGSTALFSSWYPNGTQFIFNDSMMSVAGGNGTLDGYFFWNGYMNVVGGTYLTEMTCYGLNQTAKAFGEWQNPVWVSRIAPILDYVNATHLIITDMNGTILGINATVTDIYNLLQNFTLSDNFSVDLTSVLDAISDLSIQVTAENNYTQSLIISGFNDTQAIIMNNFDNITISMVNNFTYTNSLISALNESMVFEFNFTNTMIENNFNYTNNLINQTSSTILQNTSVILDLLYLLINSTSTPVNGSVTWEDYSVDPVRYMKEWTIKTKVYDEYGRDVQSPYVACTIVTSGGANTPLTYMTPEGEHFTFTTRITSLEDLTYTTTCFRV